MKDESTAWYGKKGGPGQLDFERHEGKNGQWMLALCELSSRGCNNTDIWWLSHVVTPSACVGSGVDGRATVIWENSPSCLLPSEKGRVFLGSMFAAGTHLTYVKDLRGKQWLQIYINMCVYTIYSMAYKTCMYNLAYALVQSGCSAED